MFLRPGLALWFAITICLPHVAAQQHEATAPVYRVLFGSCIQQDDPMPILRTMRACQPELLIFLGDNIYADTSDMAVMQAKYSRLAENPDFTALRGFCPLLATWDDHDYGVNDGGAEYSARVAAQQLFLDFWQVPADSPRRQREGIYDSEIFGPPGKRLQVILLDTRYFRSPLKVGERRVGGAYWPDDDPQKTMLGDQQWNWLEEQFRKPAEVRVVASSIQLAASDAGQETWSNLPHQRQRFVELVASTGARGVVLISGDRHWAELSVIRDTVPYPLYDLTSSSFNQIHARGTPTENRYRAVEATYHRENFGVISLDWQPVDPTIRLEIRGLDDRVQLQQQLRLSELQP